MTPSPPERYHAPENRIVLPEILDELAPNHPDAIASRSDLQRINFIMGNYRFMKEQLIKHHQPEDRCVEIGAGSGQLSVELSQDTLSNEITGLDLVPRPDIWPYRWKWKQQDLFNASSLDDYDIIMASLILHHFSDSQLQGLGRRFTSGARLLIFTEPFRNSFSHTLGRLAEWTGIHPVTRHDMHVSIDAGFHLKELPELLGLSEELWEIREWQDWRGSLRVVAFRK